MPSSPRTLLDIEAHFDKVRMPPLSPYSATFAGRKIAAGKLWLDLHYKIVKGELAGEHKIVLEDFKLGKRVEAPDARDLPLDLAIALLTDSKGKMNLAVPSDRIAPAQREKLLAEALKQRPQLKLVGTRPVRCEARWGTAEDNLARRDLARMVGTSLGPARRAGR
jgi:hypothetical protein